MKVLALAKAFCISLLVVSMIGCGAEWRETTIQNMELSEDTKASAFRDMYEIALRGQLGLLKSNLKKQGLTDEAIDQLANNFAQTTVNMVWLYRQFEKANGLDSNTWIYVESRKLWLEKAKEDLDKAIKDRDADEIKSMLVDMSQEIQALKRAQSKK